MYFVLKNLQLLICKNWRVHFLPVTWELTLGFDRLKTTPYRSALAAGCTTTLMVKCLKLIILKCYLNLNHNTVLGVIDFMHLLKPTRYPHVSLYNRKIVIARISSF